LPAKLNAYAFFPPRPALSLCQLFSRTTTLCLIIFY
jgi:hypothetical protein